MEYLINGDLDFYFKVYRSRSLPGLSYDSLGTHDFLETSIDGLYTVIFALFMFLKCDLIGESLN